MVFEYMEHGDLADVLRSNDPAMGRTHVVQLREVRVCSVFLSSVLANAFL